MDLRPPRPRRYLRGDTEDALAGVPVIYIDGGWGFYTPLSKNIVYTHGRLGVFLIVASVITHGSPETELYNIESLIELRKASMAYDAVWVDRDSDIIVQRLTP